MKNKSTLSIRNIVITIGMVLAVIFLLAVMPLSAKESVAKRPCPKKIGYVRSDDRTNDYQLDEGYKVSLKKCKSSNKKIAEVKKNKDGFYAVIMKKPGKAKVTIYAKKKGSKKYKKYETSVTVYKYQNPFKSFKIGDKEYKSNFNDTQDLSFKEGISGNVNIQAEKGWKLSRISYMDRDSDTYGDIKNGTPVKINNGALTALMQHKASGDILVFDIDVSLD